jgi:hypothetical protein
MKKLLFLAVLLLSMTMANAQGLFKGFLEPVTVERIQSVSGSKDAVSSFLFRPEMLIMAQVVKSSYNELGEFLQFESTFVSRAGFGLSYSHYKLVSDKPYNDYSFAAMISVATVEQPYAGVALSASVLDVKGLSLSMVAGYDFVKNNPAKANWYIGWGPTVTF